MNNITIFDKELSQHKLHLIGIGGTGMSGLAIFFHESNVHITGSDLVFSPTIEYLRQLGMKCSIGHTPENLSDDSTLVIKSSAVKDDNPEIQKAKEKNIPVIKYAEALGMISRHYRTIAVSGCHGKTTTSAMLSFVLQKCNLAPSFVVGGVLKDISKNATRGDGILFVLEACEYDHSFLNYYPYISIITNIDVDHMDFYGNFQALLKAYENFVLNIAKNGTLIYYADNIHTSAITKNLNVNKLTYGFEKNNFCFPLNVQQDKSTTSFDVILNGENLGRVVLSIPGLHNVINSLAVICSSYVLRIPFENVSEALSGFNGVKRRIDLCFQNEDIILIDDYGHHPVEIENVIKTLRAIYKKKQITIIFQPHQYSRTKMFLNEFADVLSKADFVIITKIFRAREFDGSDNTLEESLTKRICENGSNAIFISNFDDIVKFVRRNNINGIIVTQGAGDIFKVNNTLASNFQFI